MKKTKDRFLSVRLDPKTRGILDAIADADFSTRGEIVRRAVNGYARQLRGPVGAAVKHFERDWESFRRDLARPS